MSIFFTFVAAEEQVYSESEVSTVLSKLEKEAISEAAAEQYTVVDRKEVGDEAS